MKKVLTFLTICVLLCSLCVSAYAAGGQMQANDLTGTPGQLLYLTIRLENAAQADTVGVQLAYDSTMLEMVEDDCTWEQKGEIQNFSASRQAGVWTRNQPQDLNGVLCTIAFRVVEPHKTLSTTIDCTVILKVRSDEVGRFQDQIAVSVTCEHQFADWTNVNEEEHAQICTVCQEQRLQPHQWGNGILGEDPDHPGTSVTFYTCQLCNAEKKVGADPAPTTKPTTPTTPTKPAQSSDPTVPTTAPQQSEQPETGNAGWIIAIVAAVAVVAAVVVVLWKKKK